MNLTPAMRDAILNHSDGTVSGRVQTLTALRKRGLIDDQDNMTPDGYAAIGGTVPNDGYPLTSEEAAVIGLPHSVAIGVESIANGEYGEEAMRLACTMDDRPGERATRWVARLRHKLNSAGEIEASEAIRLVAA